MALNSRQIWVDDLDTSIVYEGNWFTANDARSNSGNFGPTYLNTLHGLRDGRGSVTFNFNGSEVYLLGSNDPRNNSGTIDPSWDCLIDGVSIGPTEPFPFAENNWFFCSWTGTEPARPHTLTVDARSNGQPFWVDTIRYAASPDAQVDDPTVMLFHFDNAIRYSGTWKMMGDTCNFTDVQGSAVDIEFVGTRLSWWGLIPSGPFPRTPASASYAIDEKPPVTFRLSGLPAEPVDIPASYNHMFFQTPILEPGPHRMKVTFQSDHTVTPLTLTYLLVQGGNFTTPLKSDPSIFDGISTGNGTSTSAVGNTSQTRGGNSPPQPSGSTNGDSEQPPSSDNSSKPPVGAVIGGAIGGALFLCIALTLLGCFFYRRRSRKQKEKMTLQAQPISSPDAPYPPARFIHTNASHISPYDTTSPPFRPGHHGHEPHIVQSLGSTGTLSPGIYVKSTVGAGSPVQPLRYGEQQPKGESGGSRYHHQSQPSSSDGADVSISQHSRVVHHQDSGIRLASVGSRNTVEVPPTYTPH